MKRRNSMKVASVLATVAVLVSLPAYGKNKKGSESKESSVVEALKFKAGDEQGNEIKALKTELLVISSEKKALAQLQKLERKYRGTRMEPDILLRLAELYMRRARSERFFEVHRDSDQVASFVPKLVKEASEAGEIRKAVSIYDKIQKKFPNFRSIDIVLFNSAYARQQLGEDKAAEQLLFKLINGHPHSPLVPDSYLSIGEINFQRRNFTFALENFKAIRKYPQARVYPYGLYKAAWSYYNLQNAPAGMKELEDVVKFGRAAARAKLDAKLDLRKEALGDLALFYLDVSPSSKAVDYLKGQSQELDATPFVMRLVELYKRHSRFKDVEIVLKDVLAKMPDSEGIATAHEELIWNYERVKQRPNAVAQLVALDTLCDGRVSENSRSKKRTEGATRIECQDKMADTSKKLATKWHALWKKQGSGDDLSASAEKAYRLYLKSADAKDGDLPNVRFAFAELTFARGHYREASEHYASIEEYQKNNVKIDQKVAHDAAYASIVSLEKATENKWNDDDEKRFIHLSESYIRRFPSGQYALDLKFKRAFIAYEKERYDEAAGQFKSIGWTSAPSGKALPEKVLKAQDLYLDILNIKKDFKTLREAAQSLMVKGADSTRKTHVEKIYREAYFAEIQQMEEQGKVSEAVEAYKKFALENTSSELAPKAWWNASQLQFRMGDATGGANTCYHMHKLFPKSTNGKDCLTQAAQTFEAMGQLGLAARVLLNLALVEPDKQDHWREVAADFFALSGEEDRAIVMFTKLTEGKKRDDQIRLFEKAAQVAKESGDRKALAKIEDRFNRMGVEPHVSTLVLEQAEAAFNKGDQTKAFNISKKIIAKSDLPNHVLARARFLQAQVLEDEYRRQSVKAQVERIGLVLAIKTEKLEKAQKAYQSAIRYNDPEISVQALRRLAECYIDYATTVKGMTLPGSVSEADQQAFKAEIEQLSIPMEEKGIEAMAQALEAAKKAGLRDGQIGELQTAMNKLNMKTDPMPTASISSPVVYLPKFDGKIRIPASKGVGL